MNVSVSVSLFVGWNRKLISKRQNIFLLACYLWPWLSPSFASVWISYGLILVCG